MATVGDCSQSVGAVADVGQHSRIIENRDCRLGVKQNPFRVDAVLLRLRQHESQLAKCGADRGFRKTGAVSCIVAEVVAAVTFDLVVSDAV